MKRFNYLICILTISVFTWNCGNQTTSDNQNTIEKTATSNSQDKASTSLSDGTYYFREANKADNFFRHELILTINGEDVTGKSYSFFEEGDHEGAIRLDILTMVELDIKGVFDGTNLKLQEKEAQYGGDFMEDHIFKFQDFGTWSFEENQLKRDGLAMDKVSINDLNATAYKKLDNNKIVN